ncbi:MAG: hypothetical protein JXA90_05710 [Planctomycetes bacterium]|nr:hypothetical protein [Planctomycetota bacterium]
MHVFPAMLRAARRAVPCSGLGASSLRGLLAVLLHLGLCALLFPAAARAEGFDLWRDGKHRARIAAPRIEGPMRRIVQRTLNGRFDELFGWRLPVVRSAGRPGTYILAGDAATNPAIQELVDGGLELSLDGAGDEGFRLLTHESESRRFVIVAARTPLGLKHGCQELVFFRTRVTASAASVDVPLDLTLRPRFSYRGVYMLPCWSAYDDLETWRTVLSFHSELTLNRNWFWLAGFPLLETYGGKYEGSDLAVPENVRELIDLCHAEGMKFYIGGGWYNWHHADAAAGSIERGIEYYRDLFRLLPGADGLYLEPTGEGRSVDEAKAARHLDAIRELLGGLFAARPDFEAAVAIGKFNTQRWREALAAIDPARLYWWWCWGDPVESGALAEYPRVLRWHTTVRMSEYHGSTEPPRPEETGLAGFATSYDPGQGFGNAWNGWAAMGIEGPRDFHPHTLPFFSHQYLFRERCWNVNITAEEFASRMQRRLFDADMPRESIRRYLRLAELCPSPGEASDEELAAIEGFVRAHSNLGTPRNRETLRRMSDALDGLRAVRAKAKP